ncbi:RNA 2',3'-cyclic phosphodiesterase [Thermoanaerobacter sp. CM-CNRG TB177]|jgi:2'-5' RNA ligase|uniref:RNA 2',3'-cyclic phosphodiesterase n=1 Tax=Thermoanaerobacter sp. CM-CNRG TB177 TaxID=2800659 RepID=UPI001BDE5CD6|nr:RNA 2',3'-cyclic phosphodiesterase [Thermoanaerobacter sp. CM-CNRG TB177]MBT1279694.1 RNA 2',3'-cyclic phosphodiesterase [Thermoanaerobacter sp. CM-CNRG TB177]
MRTFIGIELGEKATDELSRFQEVLKNYTIKGRWTHKDNFHITLKFLGEVEAESITEIEDAVKVAAKSINPFYIKFDKVGFFKGNKDMRVLWVGTEENPFLNKLHDNIDEELHKIGFKKDERKFTSHITIARDIRLNIGIEEVNNLFEKQKKNDILVDTVFLYESVIQENRRKYIPIFSVPLR